MTKRVLALISSLVMLINMILPSFTLAEGNPTLIVNLSSNSLSVGEEFTASVKFGDLSKSRINLDTVGSIQVELSYPSDYIEFVSCNEDDMFWPSKALVEINYNEAGKVKYGLIASKGITLSDDDVMFTVTLKAKAVVANANISAMCESLADVKPTSANVSEGSATLTIVNPCTGITLDKDTLTIPDYVEITADVTDFSLATTMTVASNEVFNNIDTSGLDQYDDLTDAMDDLTSAMKQLLDGSSQLYDGLSTLLSKSDTLITGIDRLATGAKELASGASQLESGAKDLNSGASQLADGLDTLSGNSATLNGGAKQVFDTLLSTADTQIAAAGLQADKLTVSNYQTVLNKVIASLDSDAVQKLAYNTALKQVTAAVNAKEPEIRTGVTAAVQSKVLEGVLAAAGQSMTAEQYQQAVEAGVVPEAMQQQVAAAVNAQMQTEAVQSQINQNVEAQKQKLIDQNMKSDEVTGKIQQAVASAKQGKAQLQNLLEQLNSYNTFYQGVLQYTGGVDTAAQGAAELESGSSKLSAGATTLSKGADALKSGIGELQTGADALVDGVSQLKDGSMQLSDGLKEFDESGVQKLVDAVDGDLNGIITRFKAMLDVSTDYRSFGGISEDMDGSVKFIYKTDEISKD